MIFGRPSISDSAFILKAHLGDAGCGSGSALQSKSTDWQWLSHQEPNTSAERNQGLLVRLTGFNKPIKHSKFLYKATICVISL